MTSPPVQLREITDDNRKRVRALRVRREQRRFVASVTESLEDAAAEPEARPWARAVYLGDEPVGFVMLSWNAPDYFLWRLLVDKRYQGRGIGRAVLTRIADLVREEGADELLTSYEPGPGDPGPFYRKFGFEPTGEVDDDGEIVLRLPLSPPGAGSNR
ncbi:GNAT family N-acetyltransferase [Pseudonocardia yuanmonensis]|uniref:GNAT family N-acetyltransferase n=1 Tax=Pseudonocardia yuanmonensis TaxID=1095914 RepID=UPI0031E8044E